MKTTNRDYIKKIVDLINSEFDKAKEESGYVERRFFESDELEKIIQDKAQQIFEIFRYPRISEKKWSQLYDIAIKESKHENQSGMAPSISLTSENAKKRNWLDGQRQKDIGWYSNIDIKTYRDRYLEYLSSIGRSKSYIYETKRSSLEITRKLGDPEADRPFYVRGLVVGSVQSGKTANFNAVINSAIDVGYELIIVLSGIMEDLRKQTQRRLEKEVEGKFENGAFIGVGAISSFGDSVLARHRDVRSISVPTSVDTDFKKSIKEADFSLINKNILVCKKNTSVLKNLLLWLHNYLNENKDKIKVPLLIIDDEADNASLNNLGDKGREYASVINGHIRALLGLFEKKTYLGYTATPFGNVLQDRHAASDEHWKIMDGGKEMLFEQASSLFPKDFIELLFPPPNYIGAKHYFETANEDVKTICPLMAPIVIDHVNSFPIRLDKDTGQPTSEIGRITRPATPYDDFPSFLPKSLEEAIMCFVVSTAIRISRKQAMFDSKMYQPHNTMLIHVSRFRTWQSKTRDLVVKFVQGLDESLKNDNPQDGDKIYGDFEKIWNKYYAYIVSNIWTYLPDDYDDDFLIEKTFQDIKPLLISAVQDIEIKAINSLPPKDALVYPEGSEKTYIAIGGNRLSRGFTLEGLTINYFVRNTNFADTLLQMGRWFGYRPGYIDCCKLFTTADAMKKFNQTSLTIEDLEQKFIDMNRDPHNTPDIYALRVLTHPGVLKLTRDSILKNAKEIKFSYSDHLVQTTDFLIEDKLIKESWKAFCDHVSTLSTRFYFVKKPKTDLIEYLKYEPDNIDDLFKFFDLPHVFINDDMDGVKQFIIHSNANGKLVNWTITIKISGVGPPINLKNAFNIDVTAKLSKRKGPSKVDGDLFYTLRDEKIFKAGGKSKNIVTSGKDFQIRLSKQQIDEAEKEFRAYKYNELFAKYPALPESELRLKIRKMSVPEKAYRQKMSDKEGVLVIYLMDLAAVFSEAEGLEDIKDSITDTSIPLVGYAVGIPPVYGDIGANYMLSKFHVNDETDQDNDDFNDFAEVLNES